MAVKRLDVDRYVGRSSDIKPLDAPIGAVFYEYDTEKHFDKTLNYLPDNGWKERIQGGVATDTETVKNGFTVKTFLGDKYMVLMAGTDDTNIEAGDFLLAIQNNRLVGYVAKVNNPASNDDMIRFLNNGGYDPAP